MTITFKGYAIVSSDGFIADDEGNMPDSLRFDADWAYFQDALDAADVTLLGRHTHEAAPNHKKRRRLVVSRSVRAVVQEDRLTWWANPLDVTPEAAVAIVAGTEASVAVVGGTGVFGWILKDAGYDEFHLTIAGDVRLGTGRPLLDDAAGLEDALFKFEASGLAPKPPSWLDEAAGLKLSILQRQQEKG